MIFFMFLLLWAESSSDSGFDYDILKQKPFAISEPDCSPLPSTCEEFSTDEQYYCSMLNNTNSGQLDSPRWDLQVAVVLPNSSYYIVNIDRALESLKAAEKKSRELDWLPDFVHINYQEFNDACNQGKASGTIVNAMKHLDCLHLIIGPTCDYCIATVGRTAQYINTPVMTPTGLSLDFTLQKTTQDEEFYFLVNPGMADFRTFSEFFHLIQNRYNWKKVVLLYKQSEQGEVGGEKTCYLTMTNLITELQSSGIDYVDGDIILLQLNYTEFLINKVGVNYGIIITCASHESVRQLFIEAAKLNMMDRGEYVFFNIELYNQADVPSQPWIKLNDTIENNNLARVGYQSVYSFTPTVETNFDAISNQSRRGQIWLDGLYDGMMLYIQTLYSYTDGFNTTDISKSNIVGCRMYHEMMGKTFIGKNNEPFRMNCNAVRTREVAMVHMNSSGDYEVIGIYNTTNKTVVLWNVGTAFDEMSDTPKCGYDLSKCPTYDVVKILVGALIGVIIVGMLIVALILYRQIKLRREIEAKIWKVNHDDVIFTASKPRASIQASVRDFDGYSLAGDKQIYTNVAIYKGNRVAVKNLQNVKIELVHLNLYELKVMKDLSHDNLVKFHGACLDIPNYLLNEYCAKGSLQDILENEEVKLDWTFRISLIMDLVRGMYYLHRSAIKCHGGLKSTNCLVDSRFVLKIAGFGLSFLKPYVDENLDKDSHSFWQRQLWTAPEILNQFPFEATQKGDIYSFGIILHEIIKRKGVFYLENYMDPKEILDTVKRGPDANNGQPLRPALVSEAMCDDEVEQLMKKCWAEDSIDRPDFATLKNKLHQLNKKEDGNLLDNLLARMEQYANNLETLVEERTNDYLIEKKKCEQVLYQLLPKSVAEQLIRGDPVNAETFDSVTIYFSDIVGFTTLSANSTPLEVVDLLNDLYTCFDSIVEEFDVYKVETIGDAYMVVSGLPKRNGNCHAREIARMSLALLKNVKQFQIRHMPSEPLRLRIGIHTGPCVAGVVGLKMPRYCLFGDTVNTASRMESNGESLRIHVSNFTKEILDTFGTFELECRGPIEIKGKGTMTTYWLKRERKVVTQPGPTLENKTTKLPSTPLSQNFRKDMAHRALNAASSRIIEVNSDEAGVPLLSITSSQDTDSHA